MFRSVASQVLVFSCLIDHGFAADDKWPTVAKVETQPLIAATERLTQALDFIGAPLSTEDRQSLEQAFKLEKASACTAAIQKVLDQYCVAGVSINPESRVSVVEGPAKKELVQQGWRTFLVKVHNEAGSPHRSSPKVPICYRSTSRGKRTLAKSR